MNNIEILIDNFEQLKKNKFIIESIDPEFFFKFGENLIQENKELKEKQKEYEKQLDLDYVEENYIPKSKVKEKIEYFKECYNSLSKNPKEHLHSKTEYLIVIGELESLLEEGE